MGGVSDHIYIVGTGVPGVWCVGVWSGVSMTQKEKNPRICVCTCEVSKNPGNSGKSPELGSSKKNPGSLRNFEKIPGNFEKIRGFQKIPGTLESLKKSREISKKSPEILKICMDCVLCWGGVNLPFVLY